MSAALPCPEEWFLGDPTLWSVLLQSAQFCRSEPEQNAIRTESYWPSARIRLSGWLRVCPVCVLFRPGPEKLSRLQNFWYRNASAAVAELSALGRDENVVKNRSILCSAPSILGRLSSSAHPPSQPALRLPLTWRSVSALTPVWRTQTGNCVPRSHILRWFRLPTTLGTK